GTIQSVNPQTKQPTGQLAQFVVTADCDMTSNEIASVPVSPAIYTTGAKQNVTAFPTANDAIKIFGSPTAYAGLVVPQNMVFHKDAFALVCADFQLPKGMDMAARASDPDSGLSLSFVRGFDIVIHRMISRLDILFGVQCLYPEFACRVVGQ